MKEKSEIVLGKMDLLARSLNMQQLNETAKIVNNAKQRDGKFKIAFVSTNIVAAVKYVQSILGIEIIKITDKRLKFPELSIKIEYTYGEEFSIAVKGNEGEKFTAENILEMISTNRGEPLSIVITLKSNTLKEVDLCIIHSVNNFADYKWKNQFHKIDYACLITNALSAMNAPEKDFYRTCGQKLFGPARFSILVSDTDLAHKQQDYDDIFNTIRSFLDSTRTKCEIFDLGDDNLNDYLFSTIPNQKEQFRNIGYINALSLYANDIESVCKDIKRDANIDVSQVNKLIKQIEKRIDQIENAAVLCGSNQSYDFKVTLKNYLADSIDDYSSDIYNEIKEYLNTTDNFELFRDEVPRGLQTAWDEYQDIFIAKMKLQSQRAITKTKEQLHKDMFDFLKEISDFDEEIFDHIYDKLINTNIYIDLDGNEDDDIDGRVKKIKKAVLISAIPVAIIIGPLAGLATAVASYAMQSFLKKHMIADQKEAVLVEVENLCAEVKTNVYNGIMVNIDKASDEINSSIIKTYHDLISQVTVILKNLDTSSKSAVQNLTTAIDVLENEIPSINAEIEQLRNI